MSGWSKGVRRAGRDLLCVEEGLDACRIGERHWMSWISIPPGKIEAYLGLRERRAGEGGREWVSSGGSAAGREQSTVLGSLHK